MKRLTAIITARGGSKGVPGKNIRLCNGKPLIAYTIHAALQCEMIKGCYVTTDDRDIKIVSERYGARTIDRPKHLALDDSLSQDAVFHAIREIEKAGEMTEYFVLLQPTSPLRNAFHLTSCLKEFFLSQCLSAVAVTEAEHHPWKMVLSSNGIIKPVHTLKSLEQPRQELPTAYRVNGAIYVMPTNIFCERRCFFVDPVFPFIMDQQDSLDIDSEDDLKRVDSIMKKRTDISR